VSASYSEQLARVNNMVTSSLQDCRRACEQVEDAATREALRLLCEAADDVRTLAKLLPLAAQELREDLARQARADAEQQKGA
jgi:hypothetical protein